MLRNEPSKILDKGVDAHHGVVYIEHRFRSENEHTRWLD